MFIPLLFGGALLTPSRWCNTDVTSFYIPVTGGRIAPRVVTVAYIWNYRKFPKYPDTRKIAVINLKFERKALP